MPRFLSPLLVSALALGLIAGCSSSADSTSDLAGRQAPEQSGSWSDAGVAPSQDAGGSFGSVGTSGSADFARFRKALENGEVPPPDSIDAAGFFAEHYTSLPAPECGKTFCLHGMMAASEDLVRGGDWTLLQMGMSSPIDPATIEKPPLEIAVVLDRSGSMSSAGKMGFAKQGVKLLVDALGPEDRLTVIAFDDYVEKVFGPATVTDKVALKTQIDAIQPRGSTNLYDALKGGFEAIAPASEQRQRRVMFLTDGLATAGNTNDAAIEAMAAGYAKKHLGLTTIGLGNDVSTGLLRRLAEKGSGNFYFVEKPEAVTEVFTEELAFFVAPIAYDLELTYAPFPSFGVKEVHGTSLWTANAAGGGSISIPSVFLVSRTSSAPGTGGGRRGGGSAIIAELLAGAAPEAKPYDVAKLTLKYRTPGSTVFETQELVVKHDGEPGAAPEGGFYANPGVEKNTLILSFYVAFRDATELAQTDRPGARALLEAFQTKMTARLAGWTDEDLLDDLKILQRFIDVLGT